MKDGVQRWYTQMEKINVGKMIEQDMNERRSKEGPKVRWSEGVQKWKGVRMEKCEDICMKWDVWRVWLNQPPVLWERAYWL